MTMAYIRRFYGVPCRLGARIRLLWPDPDQPRMATVVAARDARIVVRVDGERRTHLLHPEWRIEWTPDEQAAT